MDRADSRHASRAAGPPGRTSGPLVAGVELAATGVRAVSGRRSDGRLHIAGVGFASLRPGAISGGQVVDREAVAAALAQALEGAEHRDRATRVIAAIDGDDVRTFHVGTVFDRAAATEPIVAGEVERAVRESREEAARIARLGAAEDPALRGVAAVQLRDDVAGFVVDGRGLEQPVGFQGRFVEVRTDVSLAPLLQAGAATGAIEGAKRRGTVTSGIYALARLLAASGIGDGGVLRLGVDVTAYAIVRGGRVIATRVFGLGREAFASRAATREADAAVWAQCVLAPLASADENVAFPSRWSFVGVPETLLALPLALGDAVVALRGGSVDIAPLRVTAATRVVATPEMHADDLVACGTAALAAGLYEAVA